MFVNVSPRVHAIAYQVLHAMAYQVLLHIDSASGKLIITCITELLSRLDFALSNVGLRKCIVSHLCTNIGLKSSFHVLRNDASSLGTNDCSNTDRILLIFK